jgi:transcriptional regulator with XRE-family HTH domain
MAEPEQPELVPAKSWPYFLEWRDAAGLTQEQVAERIGVKGPTVSRHETEQRVSVRLDYLESFAQAVGCNRWDPIAWPPGILPEICKVLLDLRPEDQMLVCRIAELLRERAR